MFVFVGIKKHISRTSHLYMTLPAHNTLDQRVDGASV